MGENLARILSRRGDALSAQDRLDDAIAAYRESLQWDPRSAATHTNLGNALARQERTGEALAELEEALRIDAGFGETHSSLAWIYARVGRGDEALAEARKAVELAPRLAVAHAILGRALILKGLHEEAVAPCRAAIALDAGCQPAHHDLGLALANTGCLDEAIEAFRVSIRLEPRELAGVCNLAHALQDAGRPREALDAFARGQQLLTAAHDPAPPLAEWIAEAKTLVQREERYEARVAEHVAAGTEPRGTRQLLELARTALGKGHAEVAARWYRKAFAEEEGLLERAEGGQRRHAALAALAAAASRTDGKSLPDSERAAWRSTALTWLRAEVRQVGERSRAGELAPAGARAALVPLLRDAGLAPVRTPQPLAELPEPEREGWQRLWNEVNALVPAYPGAAKN
jgi:tetratricopeptide (TPR) repeat protein